MKLHRALQIARLISDSGRDLLLSEASRDFGELAICTIAGLVIAFFIYVAWLGW